VKGSVSCIKGSIYKGPEREAIQDIGVLEKPPRLRLGQEWQVGARPAGTLRVREEVWILFYRLRSY
jgi:hypothetical protein